MNVGPQLPIAQTPQISIPTPMMTLPPSVAQLGCVGCGSSIPALGEVVKPPVALWIKVLVGVVLFSSVFGLIYMGVRSSRKALPYPDEP